MPVAFTELSNIGSCKLCFWIVISDTDSGLLFTSTFLLRRLPKFCSTKKSGVKWVKLQLTWHNGSSPALSSARDWGAVRTLEP